MTGSRWWWCWGWICSFSESHCSHSESETETASILTATLSSSTCQPEVNRPSKNLDFSLEDFFLLLLLSTSLLRRY